MMKWGVRISLAALLLLLLSFVAAGEEADREDSLMFRQLDEYLSAVDRIPPDEAAAEADFIISNVADSILRNRVAYKVYRHFRDSKVMGSENVAIHVFDRWFADFELLFDDIDEFEEAKFHAMINRPSLIGCRARPLRLQDIDGKEYELPAKRKVCVIYFYSTRCAKCRLYTGRLRELLNGRRQRLNFYSVYTGDDDADWMEYISKELAIKSSCRTRVFHLKGGDTPFALDYGVIQTPRLFLVGQDGTILGRNLDPEALETLLELIKR